MTVSKAMGAVNEAKPLDLARSCREIDLVSVPMVVSVSAGWRGKERGPYASAERAKASPIVVVSSIVITPGCLLQPSSYAVTELARLTKPK